MGHGITRRNELPGIFSAAMKREPRDHKIVSTQDFVEQLKEINFQWSIRKGNQWIENFVTTFKDISPNEGEIRLFMFYNPNGGL